MLGIGGHGLPSSPSFPGPIIGTDTTQSNSTVTGAIITAGGIGVAKNVFVGGVVATSFGSVTAPSHTFDGRLGDGMWSSAAGLLDFSVTGVRTLQLATATTGVNFWSMTPAAATNGIRLDVTGSDSSVSGNIVIKGTAGSLNFCTQASTGSIQASVVNTSSPVNRLTFTGSTTGNAVTIGTLGSDTDRDILISPGGAGVLRYGTASVSIATASTHKIAMKAADGNTYSFLVTNV